jgi:DNA-binding MarR family transcriptional regulator
MDEQMTGVVERGSDELAGQAWRRLFELAERHLDSIRREIEAQGLSQVMALFIRTLASSPPGPMSQLVSVIGVDAAWVTTVVDRLEARGDVIRRPSPTDRRVKILELTPTGQRTWEWLDSLFGTPPPEFRALGPEELRALASVGSPREEVS